jgi:glutathionylspermidine synthase
MLEGLTCGDRVPGAAFEAIKQRAVSEAFAWNITGAGRERLCDFPLLLDRATWRALAAWAVLLAREAEAAEAELLARPRLRARLGLPWRFRAALREPFAPARLRYARFDFHPAEGGGAAITEGNLDVAGGWNEASGAAQFFADYTHTGACPGDPTAILAARLAAKLPPEATVGILHLTRYTDDHQVARIVGAHLARKGLAVVFFDPTQLRAAPGSRAGALVGDRIVPLDAIFRFFPAEWAARLDDPRGWLALARRPGTTWVNPLTTILTQSKRFPLTWPALHTPLPTWSRLLPETRSPLFARGDGWVLKPATGHEGHRVAVPGATERRRLRALWWEARLTPWRWAAQRNFVARAIATPDGDRFPCIGVYVIDGEPAGIYGRLAARPLIDADAQDVAVLVRD